MTRRYRGGLIGCGFFARNHLNSWREIPTAEIVAVCDIDQGRAEAARAEFGIPAAYSDAEEMLSRERLDFVDIATTMGSHRVLVERAAAHGAATIVQKPLAARWADCLAIVEGARAAGVTLMVHENFRFQAPMRAARDIVRSGRLGPLHFGQISFRSHFDVYAAQPYLAEDERFIILDLGIHMLDLARFFLGEVAAVDCVTRRVNPAIRGEDVATMLLRHTGGATSVVDISYASHQARDPFPETLLRLEGRDGTLELLAGYSMRIVTVDGVETVNVEPGQRLWAQRPWHALQDSVWATQSHFIDTLASGGVPETSGNDNLRTYALVMAAYDSAEQGRPVVPEAAP